MYYKNLRFYDYHKSPRDLGDMVKLWHKMGHQSSFTADLVKGYHCRHGHQMVVQKEVSDTLQPTRVPDAVQFADFQFPERCLEFYYEDPALPTMLVCKVPTPELLEAADLPLEAKRLVQEMPEEAGPQVIFYMEQAPKEGPIDQLDFEGLVFRGTAERIDELIRCKSNDTMEQMVGSLSFSEQEWQDMHQQMWLCLKVLAYASIPEFKGEPLTRKGYRKGGKPKVHGRPQVPATRIVYLPKQVQAHAASHSPEGTDSTRRFYGRGSSIRYFRAARYKAMRNKWRFFPAIEGTATRPKTLYKVRGRS